MLTPLCAALLGLILLTASIWGMCERYIFPREKAQRREERERE